MNDEIQGGSGDRVTLTYPTGESEEFILVHVTYNSAEPEQCVMTLIPIGETDEPQGDSRAVSEGQ